MPGSSAPPRCFRFGRFTVDAGRRLLLCDGDVVPLTSKAFDLLVVLVESRGELLTKQDLLARVWPGQFVEEGNLTVHVSAIRKALGERRGEHRFVVTVPGWGYRFAADVRDGEDAPAPADAPPPLPAARRRLAPRTAAVVVAVVVVVALVSAIVQRNPTFAAGDGGTARAGMTTRLLTTRGDLSLAVVSRDGEWFAYVAGADGLESLWLARVGGNEPPRQLRPAEDVSYRGLAFSPGGDRLLFAAHGALHEMPVRGGAARRVLDGVDGAFALSPDGSHVAFVRRSPDRSSSALVVASVDGATGDGERDVAVLAPPREFSSNGPAWSPDGSVLAVGATSATAPGRFVLTRVRVADGALATLSAHPWNAIGRVAWLHDGRGVLFHAVDATSDFHIWLLDVATGGLRCVTPDLSRYGRASVSLTDDDRSLLAVRSEVSSTIWVSPSADIARSRPITRRAFGKLDGSAGLTWTPDGRLVYVSFVNSSYSLWTMTADGRDARRLTSSGFVDRFPQATSDGRVIVFESNRGGGGTDIWRIDADGSHLRALTTDGHGEQPALTPDGRWVLYTRVGDGAPSIWRLPIDGGTPQRVTPSGSSWPSVSPDGTLLAYGVSQPSGASEATRLVVLSLADRRSVAEFALAPGGRASNGLHWSPDGAAVLYRDVNRGLWRQPLSGGPATRIPPASDGRIYFFDWARDGRRFALSYVDEVRDVVLMTGFR